MERMTYFKDGHWRLNFSGIQYQADFVDRLAAYEDSGLTPEQVDALKMASMGKAVAQITEFEGLPIDRLRELAVADQEGRVVVLPFKVGQKVFALLDDPKHVSECEVKQIGLGGSPGFAGIEPTGERGRKYGVSLRGFGKTVFLTREEAEKALAELEGKKDG